MQHAVPGEHFQLAIVHSDRNVQRDFLAGIFQIAIDPLFEPQFLRRHFKTRFGVLVDIHFFRYWGLRHANISSDGINRRAQFGLQSTSRRDSKG